VRAHPRSRGEHLRVVRFAYLAEGSSPLTRGARGTSLGGAGSAGLIPAHAGSTWVGVAGDDAPRAHPRSRGEHDSPDSSVTSWVGSSPLTRGALAVCSSRCVLVGLIPAHAGSTSVPAGSWNLTGAHPRSRGEHCWILRPSGAGWGSSPLTRGAREPLDAAGGAVRLIPAHAGSTPKTR